MTKSTYYKMVALITAAAFALLLAVWFGTPPLPKALTIPTRAEMTQPDFHTIFEHKDTGIQMRLFGTTDIDFYYLKSVHACPCLPEHRQPRPCRQDYHWIWTGTHQEFTTQFQPIKEQKETNQ